MLAEKFARGRDVNDGLAEVRHLAAAALLEHLDAPAVPQPLAGRPFAQVGLRIDAAELARLAELAAGWDGANTGAQARAAGTGDRTRQDGVAAWGAVDPQGASVAVRGFPTQPLLGLTLLALCLLALGPTAHIAARDYFFAIPA